MIDGNTALQQQPDYLNEKCDDKIDIILDEFSGSDIDYLPTKETMWVTALSWVEKNMYEIKMVASKYYFANLANEEDTFNSAVMCAYSALDSALKKREVYLFKRYFFKTFSIHLIESSRGVSLNRSFIKDIRCDSFMEPKEEPGLDENEIEEALEVGLSLMTKKQRYVWSQLISPPPHATIPSIVKSLEQELNISRRSVWRLISTGLKTVSRKMGKPEVQKLFRLKDNDLLAQL